MEPTTAMSQDGNTWITRVLPKYCINLWDTKKTKNEKEKEKEKKQKEFLPEREIKINNTMRRDH